MASSFAAAALVSVLLLWGQTVAFLLPLSPAPALRLRGKEAADELPLPAVGDVVAFAGDWPGESETGQIRSLQRRGDAWIADVVAMEDQAGNVWRTPYKKTQKVMDVADLVPLAATYVEAVDGYLIEREGATKVGLNGTAVGLATLAEGYRATFPEDFRPEGSERRMDDDEIEKAAEAYEELKRRLALDGALAGVLGSGVVGLFTANIADGAAFALGALASVAYVVLLGREVDNVGADKKDFLSQVRFAPPVAALVTLAAYHSLTDPASVHAFSVVPRDEFVATAAGILSYRLPLFAREVGGNLQREDIANLLPGSFGVAASRIATTAEDDDDDDDTEQAAADGEEEATRVGQQPQTSVLVLSGPPGSGKTTLARTLVEDDDRFAVPRWTLLTPEKPLEAYDDRPLLDVVKDNQEADRVAATAAVVQDCRYFGIQDDDDKDDEGPQRPVMADALAAAGPVARWALRRDELLNRADGKIPVLDCDVTTARQLEYLAGARLVGVWVSLNSMADFETRLTALEEQRADQRHDAGVLTPGDVPKTVKTRLATIISDIRFGISSPMFEFNIITDNGQDAAYAKLRRAASYVFKD